MHHKKNNAPSLHLMNNYNHVV